MVRIRSNHPPTITYLERRTNDGLSKRETIRCLKRYVAREIYNDIRAALTTTSPRIERDIAA
jgi:transposase